MRLNLTGYTLYGVFFGGMLSILTTPFHLLKESPNVTTGILVMSCLAQYAASEWGIQRHHPDNCHACQLHELANWRAP